MKNAFKTTLAVLLIATFAVSAAANAKTTHHHKTKHHQHTAKPHTA